MENNKCYSKLHIVSFGLALGIVWGVSVFITGLVAMASGWGTAFVETMRTVYIGYDTSILGSIIGGIWGFVDLFVAGIILSALYNAFLCCCRGKKAGCQCDCVHKEDKITKP